MAHRAAAACAAAAALLAVILEMCRPDLLIVGNVTRDVLDGESAVGGAISYAAAVAGAFSIRACIVSAGDAATASSAGALPLFAPHDLHIVASDATLTFTHRYTFWGNHRKLRVTAAPNVTLSLQHVPRWCRQARTVLLCPLTPKDVDLASFAKPAFGGLRRGTRVGLLAQGLQRSVDGRGHVAALAKPSLQLIESLSSSVTVFLSDVETESWPNGTLERLVEEHAARFLVTVGDAGADEYQPGQSRRRHPAFDAGGVVDTNGAGDSFATAFMLSAADKHPSPAAVGNWAGGVAVTQPQRCKPQCIGEALRRSWERTPRAHGGSLTGARAVFRGSSET